MTAVQDLRKITSKTDFNNLCDMDRVATIILAGGQGSRLFPLTRSHCKPAMTFGGKYRLIDVPMSNALHSGCDKIFLITQFLSKSLHDHIFKTYRPSSFNKGFIEVLSVEEKPHGKKWFLGTADAVRQNLDYLNDISADYFLILSGDQLYQMNYQKMMQVALKTNADVVIATLPVEENQTSRLGILNIDKENRITDFIEKPQQKSLLEKFKFSIDGISRYLGSMGIYLFKRKALFQLLLTDMREDFGKHLIPTIIQKGVAAAYVHNGYWEDIGTIDSYYHANLALTEETPQFDWYDEKYSFITHLINLPAPKISRTTVDRSIICEGSIVEAEEVSHSILGPRTKIKKGSIVKDSYIIGNDFYDSPLCSSPQIGENCHIERAIIDKNASIGNQVKLINQNKLQQYDSAHIFIRDGIIIVPRGAQLPDGFTL